jgi:hypothetical protein
MRYEEALIVIPGKTMQGKDERVQLIYDTELSNLIRSTSFVLFKPRITRNAAAWRRSDLTISSRIVKIKSRGFSDTFFVKAL